VLAGWAPTTEELSIAVVPFKTLSTDGSFEYLHGDERFERLIERAREKAAAFVE